MRLHSPVDLSGNKKKNLIEKLVFGETGTGNLPIISRRANLWAIKTRFCTKVRLSKLEIK